MQNIRLADMDLKTWTLEEQMEKVREEFEELYEAALELKMNPQERNQAIGEEALDVMQACYTLLKILRLDVVQANNEHLQKLLGRHGRI